MTIRQLFMIVQPVLTFVPSMCEMILMGDLYHDFRRLI